MDITSEILESLLEFIKNSFGFVLDWLYELIFIDSRTLASNIGNTIFNLFSNIFSGNFFSFDVIIFALGLTVFIFLLKLVIRIIRG